MSTKDNATNSNPVWLVNVFDSQEGKPEDAGIPSEGEKNSRRKLSLSSDMLTGLENESEFTTERGHKTAS